VKFSKSLLVFLFVSIIVTGFFVSLIFTTNAADPAVVAYGDTVSFSSITQTSVSIFWTEAEFGNSQVIDRGGVPIATLGGDAGYTGYTDTGLTCGTTYTYTITSDFGEASNSVTTSACVTVPAAPGGLGTTAINSTSIGISWTDYSNNETGFKVYLGGTLIATTAANATSYNFTGLTCNTIYGIWVKATNAAGDSTNSNVITPTTGVCAPAAPTNLSATPVSQTQINLAWTDNSSNEANFIIYKIVNNQLVQVATPAANATSYSFTGTCGTAYSFQIVATNAGGTSSESSASATTVVCTPAAPSGMTSSPSSATSMTVNWTDNSNNETGFYLYRNGVQIRTLGANVVSNSDTGLTCGTSYSYYVVAYNAGGNSTASNTTTNNTLPCTPAAPTSLYAPGAAQTALTLAWTDNSTNETGFNVYRGAYPGTLVTTTAANTTSYTNTGLTCGTSYSYYVVATNQGYESAVSNTVTPTTLPCTPAAPTLTVESSSGNSNLIYWTDSNNETGYYLYRNGTLISQFAANSTGNYSDTGLACSTSYSYYVAAYNAGGSASSNTVTKITAPCAPSGLSASVVSQTQTNLSWTDNSNNETGFEIYRGGSLIATTAANATTYSSTGLSCNTSYSYYVRAVNASWNSSASNTVTPTTDQCTPGEATPNVTSMTQTSVTFSWTPGAPTTQSGFSYEVLTPTLYQLVASGSTSNPNQTSATLSGLQCGNNYLVRVYAYVTTNGRTYSTDGIHSSNFPTVACVPVTPTGGAASSISATQINLSWNAVGNATSYTLKRGATVIYSGGTASYSDTGLTPNTSYSYTISATNDGGTSADSAAFSNWTRPNAPSLSGVKNAPNFSILLTYSHDSGTTYTLSRVSPAATLVSNGSSGSGYLDSSLSCNTSYTYSIYATNAGGNSATTNASATTEICAPSAPSVLSASAASQSQINLSWTDNSSNETGFEIYRGGSLITTTAANATSYSNIGLTCNTSYSYYVKAINAGGSSSASNTASATTVVCGSTAPSGLYRAGGESQTAFLLIWTDNSDNETGFKIYRDGSLITTTAANVISYSDTGLTCNTSYSYYVKATNASGDSAASNTINPTTLPCTPAAPSGLSATAVSQNQIDLAWTDNASNETSYYVYKDSVSTAVLGANVTSYSSTGLTCGTSYSYYVRAVNTGGSSVSNTTSATTNACVNTPTVTNSSSITVVEDPGRPKIILKDVAGDATNYLVYVNNVFNGDIASATVTSNSYSPTNLTCPGNYTVSFFGYKTDVSVALDTSCNELNVIDSSRSNGKKCTPKIERTMKMNYCTRGFFGN
jgi:titin